MTAANLSGYGGTMAGLYTAWYRNYPQSKFHTINDWKEWKQMDKVGHIYGAYIESVGSMELWNWAGMERKKRIWIGGLSGAAYQTVIEVLDGFSKEWGWSWGDIAANMIGSGLLIGQELAWNEQRLQIKFSYHPRHYQDLILQERSNQLFGHNPSSRFLKDYNGQTYWASIAIAPFLKKGNWPKWLNLAIGYGADGLFGGHENFSSTPGNGVVFNRRDIIRYRQWYIAPDINWKKIPTNRAGVRLLFTFLNAFKFPAPTLELSNGKVFFHPFYF
ncbi:MAG: DUF2279 domain-containing protein [Bacteroidetes bacterium]|nr:DUF2279 domain-containing protein [Bacteroidota bacterium]